jgi:HEAT repeat protein
MIEAAQKWEQTQMSPSARVDAALAQVLLGDKSVVRDWIERCDDAKPASILELVRGLDAFGDTNAVQPLLKFSENTELTDEVRIAAIHALSAVCSPDPLQRTLARAYTGG